MPRAAYPVGRVRTKRCIGADAPGTGTQASTAQLADGSTCTDSTNASSDTQSAYLTANEASIPTLAALVSNLGEQGALKFAFGFITTECGQLATAQPDLTVGRPLDEFRHRPRPRLPRQSFTVLSRHQHGLEWQSLQRLLEQSVAELQLTRPGFRREVAVPLQNSDSVHMRFFPRPLRFIIPGRAVKYLGGTMHDPAQPLYPGAEPAALPGSLAHLSGSCNRPYRPWRVLVVFVLALSGGTTACGGERSPTASSIQSSTPVTAPTLDEVDRAVRAGYQQHLDQGAANSVPGSPTGSTVTIDSVACRATGQQIFDCDIGYTITNDQGSTPPGVVPYHVTFTNRCYEAHAAVPDTTYDALTTFSGCL